MLRTWKGKEGEGPTTARLDPTSQSSSSTSCARPHPTHLHHLALTRYISAIAAHSSYFESEDVVRWAPCLGSRVGTNQPQPPTPLFVPVPSFLGRLATGEEVDDLVYARKRVKSARETRSVSPPPYRSSTDEQRMSAGEVTMGV